ncbi:response regulator transcription factor [Nakamurella leprariae]|uniref:Response regulator transcription factor n=1 Tax=Nakamurella leprariae TaxID=2803911 RepID=A0A938YCJ0_9ACTN|nr:LuxR C-terminal-related transcriptional regulator [Nakamurella leprariae]MBM9467113.1 response regulator transcription factor [Nakamurella leprariae]
MITATAPGALTTLTPRERQVLELLTTGLTNRAIGRSLGVAEKTVKNTVTSVLAKLGVHSRTEAAVALTVQRLAPTG